MHKNRHFAQRQFDEISSNLPSSSAPAFLDISEILINSFNFSYEIGKLSISQRRGIIKLIPKKDANLNSIKNWRPLTLLNCDYKIATKAIASRIKMFLPKLVSDDQTGFIRDRFIGENIRLIDSVIKYTKAKNVPGLLLFLDFEKAFDTLEWPFIRKTFEHFGFGPSLLNFFFFCNLFIFIFILPQTRYNT